MPTDSHEALASAFTSKAYALLSAKYLDEPNTQPSIDDIYEKAIFSSDATLRALCALSVPDLIDVIDREVEMRGGCLCRMQKP